MIALSQLLWETDKQFSQCVQFLLLPGAIQLLNWKEYGNRLNAEWSGMPLFLCVSTYTL
jgi:hypothetical protein